MPTINPKHLPPDVLAKLGLPGKRKARHDREAKVYPQSSFQEGGSDDT